MDLFYYPQEKEYNKLVQVPPHKWFSIPLTDDEYKNLISKPDTESSYDDMDIKIWYLSVDDLKVFLNEKIEGFALDKETKVCLICSQTDHIPMEPWINEIGIEFYSEISDREGEEGYFLNLRYHVVETKGLNTAAMTYLQTIRKEKDRLEKIEAYKAYFKELFNE